jgi:hypothetical protein
MKAAIVRFFSVFAIVAAIALPSPAQAGTTGVVSGRVFDDHGHPLSGATVWIARLNAQGDLPSEVDMKSRESFLRKTNAHGFFVYPSLSPGYYLIEPSMSGRDSGCSPRVIVDADLTTYIDLTMFSRDTLIDCFGLRYVSPISERLPLDENNR